MHRPARQLMALVLLVLATLVVVCGDDGDSGRALSDDAVAVDISEVLDGIGFHEAEFVDRRASLLRLIITETGELVELNLASFAVFDCRSNCTLDIRDRLAPVGREDRLCVGFVYVEDGVTRGKIWVDRPTCGPAAGRIPLDGLIAAPE